MMLPHLQYALNGARTELSSCNLVIRCKHCQHEKKKKNQINMKESRHDRNKELP